MTLKLILASSLVVFLIVINLTTSVDFNQDLGRHLKLGEIITKTKQIPKTNLFSYTNQNFPFINHHWLSEVIFYLSTQLLGKNSLIYLKVFLIVSSLLIVSFVAIKKSGLLVGAASVLLLSPLILERSDIRPEIFAFFLFSLLLYILLNYPQSRRLFYFIPLIMLLWINLHISFVFGILIISLLFSTICLKIYSDRGKFLNNFWVEFLLIVISFASLIFNPYKINGILYPFNIFRNYGYTIVENQNLFFLNQATFNPLIKYFFLLSPLAILSLIIFLLQKKVLQFSLLFIFFILSFWQVRHFPFFVLVAIPALAEALGSVSTIFLYRISNQLPWTKLKNFYSLFLTGIFITFSVIFTNNFYFKIFDINKSFGIGFIEDGKNAAEWVKKNKLPKNVFNNFDIAGYLIYQLYPRYEMFVDNRPEAYPKAFLQDIYIKLQEDQKLRDKLFKKYHINTIVFAHSDQTPWGETFIKDIYRDSLWRLVYLDSSLMILSQKTTLADLKNNEDYFQSLVESEINYFNLLRLSRVFNLFEKNNLAQKVLIKAQELNPSSCVIKRALFYQYQNSPLLFYRAGELKRNSWWCF